MKTVKIVFLFIFLYFLLPVSCQEKSNNPVDSENKLVSTAEIQFQKSSAIADKVISAICIVSANDMDTIFSDLTVTNDYVYGKINQIPAGQSRKFEIFTYDVEQTPTYYGFSYCDVIAGKIIKLNIILYPLNNEGTVIITGTFADSSNAGKIVFQSGLKDLYDIYIMDSNSKNIRNLTNTPTINEHRPRISPNTEKILFTRKVGDFHRPFIMNLDGSDAEEILIFPGANCVIHDWSPDGNKIVCTYNRNLWIYDLITTEIYQLTQDSIGYNDPRWSPSGEWIGYYAGEYGTYKIYLIKPDGSQNHVIPNISHMECRRFAFSPDGYSVAICGRERIGYTFDLFCINIDGTDLQMITDTPYADESKLTWSPDGSKILFARFDGGDPNDLYIMEKNGSSYMPFLLMEGEQNYPHWR